MKTQMLFVAVLMLFIFSCTSNQKDTLPVSIGPEIVEAKGYVVPKDSMEDPIVILVDEKKLKKIPVGIPKVVQANTNIHPAGVPKVVTAGIPRVCTPGLDGFSLPKTIPAIGRQVIAGVPEVVGAKEAHTRDQNPQNFSSFGILQGLNGDYITSLVEDKSGNLWMAVVGSGVCKYDGKSFTNFSVKNGLSNDYVRSIVVDRNGNLWIGSHAGISKYDGKSFTHFTPKEGFNHIVNCILEDKSGNLWFGTDGGISKYEPPKVGQVASFTHFTEKEGLNSNIVISILEDKSGNLWFGTVGGGVNKYEPSKGSQVASFTHFTENEGLTSDTVLSIQEDKSGNLWFGTHRGVSKYEPLKGVQAARFIHFTKKDGLSSDTVSSILEDKNGCFWFGTNGEGISKYEPPEICHRARFIHYGEAEGLNNNIVNSILEDRRGNLWFGTDGGLSKYGGRIFTHFTVKEGLSDNYIRSILEDKSGNLWFGTWRGGVNKYDGKSFTHFTNKEGMLNTAVVSMLEDTRGNLWFGDYLGVSKYEPTKEGQVATFTHFTEKEGLSVKDVFKILEDKSGNIWFGTFGGGVNKYEPPTNGQAASFTHFTEKQGLSNNYAFNIIEDKSGNFWFSTFGGGLNKYEPPKDGQVASFTHFTEKQGLTDNNINCIFEDKSGNLWIGSLNGGVSKYELPKGGQVATFIHFTVADGLSDNDVKTIYEDKRGNLWFGTKYGLNKLEKDKLPSITKVEAEATAGLSNHGFLFKSFTYDDGFTGIGVNFGNTIHEASDGTIWIGANDRLTAFHPDEEIKDTIPPNIQLTSLTLFNENIPWQNLITAQAGVKDTSILLGNGVRVHDVYFDSLSNWYGVPEHLSLAYDNNYPTFNFVGITLHSPKKVKYQYILEGLDHSWNALTHRSEATYGNLPPGRYTFRVKATNANGYWSKELNYPFTIRSPWWLTWWAYSAYGLFFMVGVWRVHVFQKERTIRNEREKSKERELAKAKEVDQLKTSFFTNISHEFRTPLTLIKGPVQDTIEQLINNRNEVDRKKIIDRLKLVQHNSDHLLKLINQLLDLAKLESGNMTIEKSKGDINSFINAIVSSFYSMADQKHINIQVDLPPVHYEALFDKDKLETILINLINNAIKFTPAGGSVSVKAEVVFLQQPVTSNQQLTLCVKDTGIGIPEAQQSKIFEHFHKVSETHTEVGTGIGLALVKEIVTLLGGAITVKSKPGEGSEFTVVLPIDSLTKVENVFEPKEEMVAGYPLPVAGDQLLVTGNGQLATDLNLLQNGEEVKPHILIVEDHSDLRAFIIDCLGDEFYFLEAENGKAGLDIAIDKIPDLIISDIMMPEMDGITMAGKLKNDVHTSHIPLILLTAKSTEESKLKGLEKGADDYLTKPFNKQELLLKVRNAIHRQMKVREKLRAELMSTVPKMEVLSADEKFLNDVKNEILKHLSDEQFSVEVLAEEIGLSRSQLYRKIIALTGISVNELIRKLRMQKAAQLLEQKWGPIAQVAYEVGISNLSYFSKVFKEEFGVLPSEYAMRQTYLP